MTIVFVCSQNRLRSVLASEALRAKRRDLKIETGGIPAPERHFGRMADRRAREITQSHYGINLSGYRSQAVTGEMIERAARIFVLSDHNRKQLVKCFRAAQGKTELFCSRSVSDWNVNPLKMFEEDILPAAERWARLLVCKKESPVHHHLMPGGWIILTQPAERDSSNRDEIEEVTKADRCSAFFSSGSIGDKIRINLANRGKALSCGSS